MQGKFKRCTLEFLHNIEILYNNKSKRGILLREFAGFVDKIQYVPTEHNEEVIDTALALKVFKRK